MPCNIYIYIWLYIYIWIYISWYIYSYNATTNTTHVFRAISSYPAWIWRRAKLLACRNANMLPTYRYIYLLLHGYLYPFSATIYMYNTWAVNIHMLIRYWSAQTREHTKRISSQTSIFESHAWLDLAVGSQTIIFDIRQNIYTGFRIFQYILMCTTYSSLSYIRR